MSDEVLAAVIAGGVSLFFSLVTLITAGLTIAANRRAVERQLNRQLTDRLYDLRIEHYPKAFVITENLGKIQGRAKTDLPAYYQQFGEELRSWRAGVASFIMSDHSLRAYYELIESLKANLALGDRYNDQQLERIWQKRTEFRRRLREDVGLLFSEDERRA